jgi:hypothetical protein
MGIVAAGMHLSGHTGPVLRTILLFDREGIEFSPKGNAAGSFSGAPDHSNYPETGNARPAGDSIFSKCGSDEGSGFFFLLR